MIKSSSRPKPASPVGAQAMLIAGMVVGLAALVMDVRRGVPLDRFTERPEDCQGEANANVIISREQLAQFLTISERDSKAKVEQVLQTPYCLLPSLEIRAGTPSERAVYPLAFDRQTWLVVLYEGEEYAGYQFRVQR
ncbi:hypothetical protein [Leptolyngbya ohadii]|uniref:hypothetical protein n=1 Tax=Leptolyngbya ohadii TaxID=1962290 RepID=UPI000B59C3B2|nr:hypothetical protein [Leptolyngbya ohadii]